MAGVNGESTRVLTALPSVREDLAVGVDVSRAGLPVVGDEPRSQGDVLVEAEQLDADTQRRGRPQPDGLTVHNQVLPASRETKRVFNTVVSA